ncbi:MAG: hypothetical protein WBD73_03150 [Candidatus Acidiferrales bacterium]
MNSEIDSDTVKEKRERARPQIVETYRDFAPPPWLKTIIEKALDSVPANYLAGLKTVVLTNKSALSRDQRRQKIWQRSKTHRLAEARGAYYRATRSRPASVWLYVDNIMRPFGPWYFRVPIAGVTEFAEVLFHEIGHHIHTVHKPVYDGKENVAEDWSKKLLRRFCRRRYWYAVPVLYPLATTINIARRIQKKVSRKIGQR